MCASLYSYINLSGYHNFFKNKPKFQISVVLSPAMHSGCKKYMQFPPPKINKLIKIWGGGGGAWVGGVPQTHNTQPGFGPEIAALPHCRVRLHRSPHTLSPESLAAGARRRFTCAVLEYRESIYKIRLLYKQDFEERHASAFMISL